MKPHVFTLLFGGARTPLLSGPKRSDYILIKLIATAYMYLSVSRTRWKNFYVRA